MVQMSLSRRGLLRALMLGVTGIGVVGGLAACGRKGQLKHPEGTQFPKVYPAPKKSS